MSVGEGQISLRRRRDQVVLVFLVAIGLTTMMDHGVLGMFMWDEAEYASIGRSLVQGEGYAISGRTGALRPPLLPLSVAASLRLAGRHSDGAALAAMLLYAVLALWVLYWCVGVVSDWVTGMLAALLLASTPLYRNLAPLLLTEVPFICSFTAAVWLFYRGLEEHPRWFSWAWACFGIALLTRYNALFFGPIAAAYLPFAYFTNRPATTTALRSRAFWLAPLAGAAVVAPWLLRQYVVFGDPWIGFRQNAVLLPSSMEGSQPANFYLVALPAMLSWPIVVLLVAGIWRAFDRADRVGILSLVTAATIMLLLTPFDHKQPRLVSSALPFLATAAALGLHRVVVPTLARVAGGRLAWGAVGLACAALFSFNALSTGAVLRSSATLGYPSFLDAMSYLRENTAADEPVLSPNYPQVYWYSGRRSFDYPDDPGELPEILQQVGWSVIVNFERGQPPYAGALLARLEQLEPAPDGLLVFRDDRFVTILARSELLLRVLQDR